MPRDMNRRLTTSLLAWVALLLSGLAGCASDAEFPPAQPGAAASHFKVTQPGQFPIDVYLSAWGDGYVIYAPGQAPIHLISDKKGGYMTQRLGDSTSFVAPMKDGSGWRILRADGPATFLLKDKEGPGWFLQAPGELPTLIQPQ
jgi:hypothetical protein